MKKKDVKWRNIFKGMAMGMVETVPGVSSSTIAMVLGIYENIILAISSITTKRYKKSLLFLIPIVIGILIGAVFSIVAVKYFLDNYPVPTYFLFIGLIVGMLPFIWKSGRSLHDGSHTYKSYHFVVMICFFVLIAALNLANNLEQTIIVNLTVKDYVYLFFSGWLASIALVLPGMSGALILMIVGAYHTSLNALFTIDIAIILTVGLGIIVGILITGKLVQFLLHHYHQSTYAAIIGLLAGSVVVLFPGRPMDLAEFIISMLTLVVGFVFAYMVSNRKTPDIYD